MFKALTSMHMYDSVVSPVRNKRPQHDDVQSATLHDDVQSVRIDLGSIGERLLLDASNQINTAKRIDVLEEDLMYQKYVAAELIARKIIKPDDHPAALEVIESSAKNLCDIRALRITLGIGSKFDPYENIPPLPNERLTEAQNFLRETERINAQGNHHSDASPKINRQAIEKAVTQETNDKDLHLAPCKLACEKPVESIQQESCPEPQLANDEEMKDVNLAPSSLANEKPEEGRTQNPDPIEKLADYEEIKEDIDEGFDGDSEMSQSGSGSDDISQSGSVSDDIISQSGSDEQSLSEVLIEEELKKPRSIVEDELNKSVAVIDSQHSQLILSRASTPDEPKELEISRLREIPRQEYPTELDSSTTSLVPSLSSLQISDDENPFKFFFVIKDFSKQMKKKMQHVRGEIVHMDDRKPHLQAGVGFYSGKEMKVELRHRRCECPGMPGSIEDTLKIKVTVFVVDQKKRKNDYSIGTDVILLKGASLLWRTGVVATSKCSELEKRKLVSKNKVMLRYEIVEL